MNMSAMKMQTMWRGVAMADEAIAALRKQILAFKAPSLQELRQDNEDLKAKVVAAKVTLEQSEAKAMPNTKEILDKQWTVRSEMFQSDFQGRHPAIATVDQAVDAPTTIRGDNRNATGASSGPRDAADGTKVQQAKKKDKQPKKPKQPKPPAPVSDDVEPLSRLDLRVGRIVEVSHHPDASKLYVEKVDIGEAEPRQILSGLVDHVPIDQMQNRLAIFLLNLKPAKMRGIESQGMIMCASGADKVEIMQVPVGAVPGDKIVFDGFDRAPDARLNPKKKIWEKVAPDLAVDADGVGRYKTVEIRVQGREGACVAPSLKGVPIK